MTIASRFDLGDVVLVPFPFTDQSGTKRRPAVVVSLAGYNMSRRDIVIMAITSLAGNATQGLDRGSTRIPRLEEIGATRKWAWTGTGEVGPTKVSRVID